MMQRTTGTIRSAAVAACLAFGLGAPAAQATFDLELDWWVDGAPAASITVPGVDIGDGKFSYAGSLFYLNPQNPLEIVNLSYSLSGKPDPNAGSTSNVLLSGNIAIENLFSSVIDVQLTLGLPIKNPLLPGTIMSGSVAAGLTPDGEGGAVSSVGVPVWRALTDDTPVGPQASLFFDPWSLENPGPGSVGDSADFGIPVPVAGGPIADSIGIDLNFSLTPLDQTSFTSVLSATIPGPGTLVLLAAAGLAVRRRRR